MLSCYSHSTDPPLDPSTDPPTDAPTDAPTDPEVTVILAAAVVVFLSV